jgi:hypothetical protein
VPRKAKAAKPVAKPVLARAVPLATAKPKKRCSLLPAAQPGSLARKVTLAAVSAAASAAAAATSTAAAAVRMLMTILGRQ